MIGFFEGISLLVLVFIGMPLKHYFQDPSWVKFMGPVHGALFLFFVFTALRVSIEQQWKFKEITWKVIVASFVPFGTFYVDHKILKKLQEKKS